MAGTANVGTIEYEARINTKQLAKDANDAEKTIGNSANRSSSGFSTAMIGATTAVGVGFGVMAGMAIKSFANYEQLAGGIETLFKGSADEVKKYANEAYKTAGMSANEYMETSISFSSAMLKSLGGDTKKASELSNQAIIDMSDNVNKLGTNAEMVKGAYVGMAKGNFTMMDNLSLGIKPTQEGMAELINQTKVMGSGFVATAENIKDVPFAKMTEAVHILQTEMGIAGTTSKEATETISGSWKSLQGAFTNVLTGVEGSGQQLSATMTNMLDQLAKKVPGIVATMMDGLMIAIKEAIDKQFGEGAFDILSTVAVAFTALAVAVTVYRTAITIATGIQALFNAVMSANPIVVVTIALIALVAGLVYFFTQTETGKAILQSFNDWINANLIPTIRAIGDWFVGAWNTTKSVWGSAVSWFTGIWNGIKNVFAGVGGFFQGVWNTISRIFGNIGQAVGSAISGAVKGAINSMLSMAVGKINGFIDVINGVINVVRKVSPVGIPNVGRMNVPQLANGGVVTSPTLAMIGEGRESEAVIPLSKLDAMLSGNGGGGSRVENNIREVHIHKEVDGEALLRKMAGDAEVISKGLTPSRRQTA